MITPQIAQWRDAGQSRAFKRFAVQFTIPLNSLREDTCLAPTPAVSKVNALVTNVSMSGLGFTSPQEFPIGTLLEIEIKINAESFVLPTIVRRCTAVQRPRRIVYGCGVQYVKSEATVGFIPALAKYLTLCGALTGE